MSKKEIETLIELISKLVGTDGMSWSEKKALIIANASDDDKTNINEFASWFDE